MQCYCHILVDFIYTYSIFITKLQKKGELYTIVYIFYGTDVEEGTDLYFCARFKRVQEGSRGFKRVQESSSGNLLPIEGGCPYDRGGLFLQHRGEVSSALVQS